MDTFKGCRRVTLKQLKTDLRSQTKLVAEEHGIPGSSKAILDGLRSGKIDETNLVQRWLVLYSSVTNLERRRNEF